MPHEYQMHFARADGELGLTLFLAADDDGAATIHAVSELDAHASFAAVELRHDGRLVTRIERSRAAAGPA